jgi:hypothetical protein
MTNTPAESKLLASRRHTAGTLFLVFALGVAGRVFTPATGTVLQHLGHVRIYLAGLAVEWALFAYVCFGVRHAGKTIREIIDESPLSVGRFGVYAGIAVGAMLVWIVLGGILGLVLRPSPIAVHSLRSLLPHHAMEKTLWTVFSASAGFCEEFIYRGYLLQQIRRLSGSLSAAIILQAALFGVAHAALPWKVVVSVMCLALLLGGLAAWRRSLVPGMLLHAGFDILTGVLTRG